MYLYSPPPLSPSLFSFEFYAKEFGTLEFSVKTNSFYPLTSSTPPPSLSSALLKICFLDLFLTF